MSPARSMVAIRESVEAALSTGIRGGMPAMATEWGLRIEFANPVDAYRGSWYPGADYVADRTLQFRAKGFVEAGGIACAERKSCWTARRAWPAGLRSTRG